MQKNITLQKSGWLILTALSLVPAIFWFLQDSIAPRFATLTSITTNLGNLFGLIGLAMFALVIILSARLKFLEKFFNGINDSYVAHHFFGGLAFCLLLFHPLFIAYSLLSFSFKNAALFFLPSADWALNFGQLALFTMILALVITFYTSLKYQVWKFTHKFLGLAFILAFFHAFFIGPDIASNINIKVYLFILGITAILAYFYRTLFGYFFVKTYDYTLSSIKPYADKTWEIELEPNSKGMNFLPGQFAFVKIASTALSREPHPFSMSSAPGQPLKFAVKELGDYTNKMGDLKVGDKAEIEGPFGVFDFRKYGAKEQIWIAGGIGIAPFLSMLSSLTQNDKDYKITLYYSCKNENLFAFKNEIEQITNTNKNFKVYFWSTDKEGFITAEKIFALGHSKQSEVFICGPVPMMQALKAQFLAQSLAKSRVHMEEFQLY